MTTFFGVPFNLRNRIQLSYFPQAVIFYGHLGIKDEMHICSTQHLTATKGTGSIISGAFSERGYDTCVLYSY